MKGLILSGGTGSRLRPLTHTSAKQLIPVANKPIIFYGIEALLGCGIKEIGIIVGDTKDDIMAEVGDGSRWTVPAGRQGIKIEYIEQDVPLGLAHAVKIAEDFIGSDSFIMYLGDNILKDGLAEFAGKFKSQKPNALILLTPVPNPEQFGNAEVDKNSKVLRLVEKPKHPKSDLALVGVYLFDSHIFKAVRAIKPSWRNELEITDAIQWLLDNGYTVESHKVTGWWKDTGKPSDILEANQLILESIESRIEGSVDDRTEITGRVMIEKGAKVTKSTLRGPIVIGKDSKITDSYLGPFTSIGDNVTVEASEIEHSIVLSECEIKNVHGRIDQSLIGRGAKISSQDVRPSSHRFVLGDRSDIVIA